MSQFKIETHPPPPPQKKNIKEGKETKTAGSQERVTK